MGRDPLMPIGMFSRASLLSVKALRAYHEAGILVPAAVDPSTGYRSYHPGQLADARVLRRLRELDVPLAAVKEVLDARDPEITAKVLAEHEAVMRERLAAAARIVAELQAALGRPEVESPVHVRRIEHQHALAIEGRASEAGFVEFFSDAFTRLPDAAARHGLAVTGPPGALYPPTIPDGGPQPVTAYLPVRAPGPVPDGAGVRVTELPAETVASVVHVGPYETVAEPYATLGAWVAYHARSAERPVREIYEVSYPEPPDRFRTEICWPIIEEERP